MSYITTTNLSDRLGATIYARLTDRVAGTSANATIAQQIVDEAEAEANSYLAERFATPLDLALRPELANVLRRRVLDLAECAAWRGSPFIGSLPERVQQLYEDAVTWFRDLGSGRAQLPAAAPPAGATAIGDGPQFSAAPRTFTAGELDGL